MAAGVTPLTAVCVGAALSADTVDPLLTPPRSCLWGRLENYTCLGCAAAESPASLYRVRGLICIVLRAVWMGNGSQRCGQRVWNLCEWGACTIMPASSTTRCTTSPAIQSLTTYAHSSTHARLVDTRRFPACVCGIVQQVGAKTITLRQAVLVSHWGNVSGCMNPSLQRLVTSTAAALFHKGTSWQRATLSMPLRLQLPLLSGVSCPPPFLLLHRLPPFSSLEAPCFWVVSSQARLQV